MNLFGSYELAQYKVRELHRQAEIDRLARGPNEIKASVGNTSRTGWLGRLVGRPAAAGRAVVPRPRCGAPTCLADPIVGINHEVEEMS
jgi:hypothetical protein